MVVLLWSYNDKPEIVGLVKRQVESSLVPRELFSDTSSLTLAENHNANHHTGRHTFKGIYNGIVA